MESREGAGAAGDVVPSSGRGGWIVYLTVAGTLLGFGVPALHFGDPLGQDWKYFDSLTLVVRSLVLHYRRMPLHDPWVMGGMDILGNPQSRVFSPGLICDLLLGPYYANFAYLIVYALLGAWGAQRLLRGLGISPAVAAAGALLYVNSTWFSLHFAEGHIPFGSFYLLPWVLHFTLDAAKPTSVFCLGSLLALFVLDGGMYPFIFSILLIVGSFAVRLVDLRAVVRGAKGYWGVHAMCAAALALVVAAKVVPVLAVYGWHASTQGLISRSVPKQATAMPLSTLRDAFFSLHQTIYDQPPGPHRFQEYGCYLGVVAVLVALRWLLSPGALGASAGLLVLMGFWLWTATGWGGEINPWTAFQRIPLIDGAHVQSRYLLLFHLFFVILVCRGLDRIRRPLLANGLAVFLVLEGLVACNYTWLTAYVRYPGPTYEKTIIDSNIIKSTVRSAAKPWHYFDGTLGAKTTYEPAEIDTAAHYLGEPGYRGEVYCTSGCGQVALREFTPGRIELAVDSSEPMTVEVNSNYLEGWSARRGRADVYSTADKLIGVRVPVGQQSVVLEYSPWYLPWILASFMAGSVLWLCTGAVLLRRREAERREAATFDSSQIPVGTPVRRPAAESST